MAAEPTTKTNADELAIATTLATAMPKADQTVAQDLRRREIDHLQPAG